MENLRKKIDARGQGGFTLIELLVVIAILGILAAVVVFAVGNTTSSAGTSACKTESSEMETGAQAYKAAILSGSADQLLDDPATAKAGFLQSLTGKYFVASDNGATTATGAQLVGFGYADKTPGTAYTAATLPAGCTIPAQVLAGG